MKPESVEKALNDSIQAITDYEWLYSVRPGKDNTRRYNFQELITQSVVIQQGQKKCCVHLHL